MPTPVDFDPFSQGGAKAVPVDNDPFASTPAAPKASVKPSLLDTYENTITGAGHQVAQDIREDVQHETHPGSLVQDIGGVLAHPLQAGGIARVPKEASDVFSMLTSPFLGGPNNVIKQATQPSLPPSVDKLYDKRGWFGLQAPRPQGVDVLQALGGVGPEMGEVELAGPVAKGGTQPVMRWAKRLHGLDTRWSPAQQEIISRIAKGAKAGGPTAQDMLELARKHPEKPLTLMDTGSRPVKGLAGKTYRTGGEAAQRIGDALEQRNVAQGGRVESDISRALGAGSAHATEKALMAGRQQAATPLYTAAYAANPVVRSSVVDEVLRTKWGASAWKAARDKARLSAIQDRRPVPDKFSLEVLDLTKQGLDDAASESAKAGRFGLARDIRNAKNMFLRELDDADQTGMYAKARGIWAGDSASMEALDFGREALKRTPEENAEAWAKLSPGDKEFARLGLSQTLRDQVMDIKSTRNAAERLALTEGLKRRVRPFFDSDENFNKFFDAATAENTMFRTRSEITGGSQTAEREAEDARPDHLGHAGRVGGAIVRRDPIGIVRHGSRWLGDVLTRDKPQVANETAEILTKPLSHPTTSRLLREVLADKKKAKTFGSAPYVAPVSASTDRSAQ